MLNIFVSGTPLVTFYHSSHPVHWAGILMPDTIFISRQGMTAGLYLFARVGLSLSMGMLLTLTTPAAALFKSMQEF
jgi:energy-coupling factor transporter transmembrane protein EcfT